MLTRQQVHAIHAALFTLDNAGINGTQIRVVNNGNTSTVWVDEGTVYMLVEFHNGDESEHEFPSLVSFLNSFK